MPRWQLETSSPELTPPPGPAGANEELCPMSAAKPLPWPEYERGADRRLKHAKESDHAPQKSTATIVHGATWTTERVVQLKRCIGAGLSCSQIAAEIGVSRNAVIGKINRLGLSRPKVVVAREPAPKRSAWRPRPLTQHQILMDLPPGPLSLEEAAYIPSGPRCSLLELSPGKCRWPISDPGTESFCFCGNGQVEGLPYCAGHARMAYKSAARSRNGARP
jgi:GcrA cell cycle regulator